MKNEMSRFYDETQIMSMECFVELLLASLANKKKLRVINNNSNRVAVLPSNYKERIQEIMYQDDGMVFEWSKLINTIEYYHNQSNWEFELGLALNKFISENHKQLEFNFIYDGIQIEFTPDALTDIFSKFDEETLDIMDHFTTRLTLPILERDYQLTQKEIEKERERERFYGTDLGMSTLPTKTLLKKLGEAIIFKNQRKQ